MASSPARPTEVPPSGYRPCAGIVLVNPAGLVFAGERRGPALDSWQMPQGGIDPGETPEQAARRELREETGITRIEPVAASRYWYSYELPPALRPAHWGGRFRGQTQKWFAYRFTGADSEVDIGGHQPEFTAWRWTRAADLLDEIVAFKRPVYEAVIAEFRHLLAP